MLHGGGHPSGRRAGPRTIAFTMRSAPRFTTYISVTIDLGARQLLSTALSP
jgi:hypothetical protein